MGYKNLKILVTEPADILRSGLLAILKRLIHYQIQIFECNSYDLSLNYIKTHKPDLLIINPVYWGIVDLKKLRTETNCPDLRCVAIVAVPVAEYLLDQYDGTIHLQDSFENIEKIIDQIYKRPVKNQKLQTSDLLSSREKEVLICVVKGMTNKTIAKTLFLSTHTVISHRRNISKKLEIHSTAGLTVYAIMNKLVELQEINDIKDVDDFE
jgi:DNA-binding NarL/FixJ family response regulator